MSLLFQRYSLISLSEEQSIRLNWAQPALGFARPLQVHAKIKWVGLSALLGTALSVTAAPFRSVPTVDDESIRTAAQKGGRTRGESLTEFLDASRFPDTGYEASLTDFLCGKSQGKYTDWRQLQRYGVDEKALPPASVLGYHQPSFWEAYRCGVIAAIVLVVLQAILIATLLVERRLRRRTAAELLDSEKRMNSAANAVGVGMWTWNIGRNEIWANSQARTLYGIGQSEPIDFQRFLGSIDAADLEPAKKAAAAALASNAGFETQYRVIHPDGQNRWVSMQGQVEADADGQPVSVVGVSHDITSRKSTELAAEQHRNEMVRMARVGLAGQLSGSIAHELNQPLSAILANALAAQRLLAREPVNWREIGEILKDIVEDDQRAVEVIRRLRSLFERRESLRQPVNPNEVVREALKLAHNDIVAHQVSLLMELADDLPAVAADWVQLQQLMLNLIVNACEAMAENEPDTRTLTIRTWTDDGREVMTAVADTGKGVDAGVVERLFESFFTTKANGMGMGLAISRSIVEAHGGQLVLSNNSERGAAFRFSLPAIH
ncbi:MAG: ATP-binding protein [Methylococcaceae bacterium]|nr:ATP-binding protein [Methylococcaceae bacterium]